MFNSVFAISEFVAHKVVVDVDVLGSITHPVVAHEQHSRVGCPPGVDTVDR